jgi:hypothetical protein
MHGLHKQAAYEECLGEVSFLLFPFLWTSKEKEKRIITIVSFTPIGGHVWTLCLVEVTNQKYK